MDFIASLIYEVKMTGSGREFYEEHLIRLEAENERHAEQLAIEIAQSENEVLDTAADGFQIWNFIHLRYLIPVQNQSKDKVFLTRTLNREELNVFSPEGLQLISA
ncbi:MAG: DUF4288 domain-containing protein [Bacteroidetes bacterium]|nr:DUF4288 domain-containing protein [Bacteroidota bacterium]